MSSFNVDPKQFLARIGEYQRRQFAAKLRAMNDNANDLWKESFKLAPVDEGTLIGSVAMSRHADQDADLIEFTVGYNTRYAAEVHNDLKPAPGAKKSQGPTTRNRPPTEFGEAGGLYLQRPLLGKATRWTAHIAKKLKAVR